MLLVPSHESLIELVHELEQRVAKEVVDQNGRPGQNLESGFVCRYVTPERFRAPKEQEGASQEWWLDMIENRARELAREGK